MRHFFELSHSGNKFRNVREAKLVAATFLVNAGNAARRVAMLRTSPQPRGRKNRASLVRFTNASTYSMKSPFSRRMGVTVGLLGLLRNEFLAQGVSEKLRTALS